MVVLYIAMIPSRTAGVFTHKTEGVKKVGMITDGQFEVIEQNMEECAPEDGRSDTAINDLFWFKFETIAQCSDTRMKNI